MNPLQMGLLIKTCMHINLDMSSWRKQNSFSKMTDKVDANWYQKVINDGERNLTNHLTLWSNIEGKQRTI